MATLNQAIDREGGEAARRIMKRQQARDLQETARKYEKAHGKAIDAASITLGAATHIPEPHVKTAAAAASIVLQAVKYTGKAIGGIMMSVGRYKERSQEIASTNEQLIEAIQQSLQKIVRLKRIMDIDTKKQDTDLDAKIEEESKIKRFGRSVMEGAKKVVDKVRGAKDTIVDKTDFITNAKAGMLEKSKKAQAEYKVEKENYTDLMHLLQIKLLQDDIKQIDKLLSLQRTLGTIASDLQITQTALQNLESSKKKSNKEVLDLHQKIQRLYQDQTYYANYKEKTPQQLNSDKAALISAIREIEPLTKMGRAQSLQAKGIDADRVFSKEGVMVLYEQLHSLKEALCSLPTKTQETETLCSK
jgi:hypothetical protein